MDKTLPVFVIDPAPKVWWPVVVSLPVDDGAFGAFQFEVQQAVLSEAAYGELIQGPSPDETNEQILQREADIFVMVVHDWRALQTTSGDALPFCEQAFRDLLNGPQGRALRIGMWRAIGEVRRGERLGNSAPQLVTG
jgi:hypothetical protein